MRGGFCFQKINEKDFRIASRMRMEFTLSAQELKDRPFDCERITDAKDDLISYQIHWKMCKEENAINFGMDVDCKSQFRNVYYILLDREKMILSVKVTDTIRPDYFKEKKVVSFLLPERLDRFLYLFNVSIQEFESPEFKVKLNYADDEWVIFIIF